MPTSSAIFETALTPEPRLRKCVLLCGGLATIAGSLIILFMPLPWLPRTLLAAVFVGENLRELRRFTRGAARLQRIQLDAEGNVAGIDPDGRYEPMVLLSGSIVLKRLAWLRVRFADGSEHGELFQGDPARDPAWQRLQLIWRHRRTPVGSQDGS